jgi:4'-phosphopantetheinyl transferase
LTLDENRLEGNRGPRLQSIASPVAKVELWWCDLRPSADALQAFEATLSEGERTRARRFGTLALRERYIMGRGMLREILGEALSASPASIAIVRGERGRPQLAGEPVLDFNVTHTHYVAMIAMARGVRVGVDVERLDRQINTAGIARKFLTDSERANLAAVDTDDARRRSVLSLWTCKEAMSKATGDALSAPFAAISVALPRGPRLERGPGKYAPERWSLYHAAAPADYVATVALWDSAAAS